MVRGHGDLVGQFGQRITPVRQLGLSPFARRVECIPLPQCVIRKLDGQGGPPWRAAFQSRAVGRDEILEEDAKGGMVADDVVDEHDQDMRVGAERQQGRLDQRSGLRGEHVPAQLGNCLVEPLFADLCHRQLHP